MGTYALPVTNEAVGLEQVVLAGYSEAAGARVVAQHRVGDYAGLYVRTNDEIGQADVVVIALRDASGWSELCSGSAGGSTWIAFPDDEAETDDETEPLGVLVALGDLTQPGTVEVECEDQRVTLVCSEPHWVALFVGVDAHAMSGVRVLEGARQ